MNADAETRGHAAAAAYGTLRGMDAIVETCPTDTGRAHGPECAAGRALDSSTLTHAAIMVAICDTDLARSAATLRDYASECDRVLATTLAAELRGYANKRAPIAPKHGLSAHDLTPATTTGAQHRATVDAIRSAWADTLRQIVDGRIPAARGYVSTAANELNKRDWALSVATPSVRTATQSVYASLTDDGWTHADAMAVARRVRYALCCQLDAT